MILSFHPCFEADKNIICAGRDPDENDLEAVKQADKIILPQGCSEKLYRLCKQYGKAIFPNFDARFKYPGKTGQARLFKIHHAPFPVTYIFSSLNDYRSSYGNSMKNLPMPYPFVFKLDWGGEGDGVFLVRSDNDVTHALIKAAEFEKSGVHGFLIQEYIRTWDRTLRVVVIGKRFISYWRVQQEKDVFGTSVSKGAQIQRDTYPVLEKAAVDLAGAFCSKTGINLAGFDFIFREKGVFEKDAIPLFLEINYFFGRQGLGGSKAFYKILEDEIDHWLLGGGCVSNQL